MTENPEAVHSNELPEAVNNNELPEVFHAPAQTHLYKSYGSVSRKESTQSQEASPTICSLRPTTFWLLILLALVIVSAAVGGGVGGSLAVQNAKSNTYITTASIAPLVTPTPSAVSSTPPSTSSTLPNASTSIYYAPAASLIPLLDVGCPPGSLTSHIIAGSYNTSASFKVFCNQDYGGDDLTGIVAYSIIDCIDACLTLSNYINRSDLCVGISIQADISHAVLTNHGANCWLKGANALPTLSPFTLGSGGSARLCRDSSCSSFA